MEILSFIFSAENVRTLFLGFIIFFAYFGIIREIKLIKYEIREETNKTLNERFLLFQNEINERFTALRNEINERFISFHRQLKENDFAHLERTIKALTYMLEKNKFLSVDDKNFIDDHLND